MIPKRKSRFSERIMPKQKHRYSDGSGKAGSA
jgi:hypothetical protein